MEVGVILPFTATKIGGLIRFLVTGSFKTRAAVAKEVGMENPAEENDPAPESKVNIGITVPVVNRK